jgi:UDP:flavonoid glycosyltransferase YjiC (YdhE family)
MKVVLASYGSRGDVEPCAAAGRELLRRGHDVCMAVPPNMLGFVESAGLAAVSYGPDSREQMNPAADFVRNFATKIRNPISMLSEVVERVSRVKTAKTTTLKSLAEGADLLVAGFNERGLAANIAEYYGIPLAVMHFFPARVWASEGLYASVAKDTDDALRRALGLSEEPGPSARPVLEIQAYDELCLPGPAAEWVEPDGRQPFVGALTLELPADADDEALSWIAAGPPPIYFGFGSTLVASPGDTVAGLRAGIPTLILWLWLDQPVWATVVKRLKVGSGRQFSTTTQESLIADLRSILKPQYITRARAVATQMTTSAEASSAQPISWKMPPAWGARADRRSRQRTPGA